MGTLLIFAEHHSNARSRGLGFTCVEKLFYCYCNFDYSNNVLWVSMELTKFNNT